MFKKKALAYLYGNWQTWNSNFPLKYVNMYYIYS